MNKFLGELYRFVNIFFFLLLLFDFFFFYSSRKLNKYKLELLENSEAKWRNVLSRAIYRSRRLSRNGLLFGKFSTFFFLVYTRIVFEADNRFKFWKGIVESDATIKLWRQSLFLSRYYYQIDRLYNTLYFLHVIFTLFPFVRLQNVPEMFSISPYTLFHSNGIFLSYLWNNLHTK